MHSNTMMDNSCAPQQQNVRSSPYKVSDGALKQNNVRLLVAFLRGTV